MNNMHLKSICKICKQICKKTCKICKQYAGFDDTDLYCMQYAKYAKQYANNMQNMNSICKICIIDSVLNMQNNM